MERGRITLILGGTSSGKSARALTLLAEAPGPHLFVATGRGLDADMRRRILAHKRSRPAGVEVLEVLADLPQALRKATNGYGSVLVDSLDFWLFSRLEHEGGASEELASQLADWTGPDLFVVSCETGLGPVAREAATRRFVAALGELNQRVAALADRVELVAAGQPLRLK